MTDPIDTSQLGPIRITPDDPMKTAFDSWWSAVCRQGDPIRMGGLTWWAFRAGWEARDGADMQGLADRMAEDRRQKMREELDRQALGRDASYALGDVRRDGCIKVILNHPPHYRWISQGEVMVSREQARQALSHGWVIKDCPIGEDSESLYVISR